MIVLWNRLRVIEFPTSYEERENPAIKRELKERENLEGVLLWALEGAKRWYEKGKLDVPEISKDTKKSHRKQADGVGQWIGECCVLGSDERVVTHVARSSYSKWCEENEYRPKGAKMFNDSLRSRGLTPNFTERVGAATQKIILGLGVR